MFQGCCGFFYIVTLILKKKKKEKNALWDMSTSIPPTHLAGAPNKLDSHKKKNTLKALLESNTVIE